MIPIAASPLAFTPACRKASPTAESTLCQIFFGIVLDPAGLWKMLGELDVDPRLSEPVLTHHERRGSRRPLVDGKDAARHAYTGYQTAELSSGPLLGDQRAPNPTGTRTGRTERQSGPC